MSYWLDAVDEHSLHSPFFFDFYSTVVKGKQKELRHVEALRKKLLNDKRSIIVNDLGSKSGTDMTRTISDIARRSLSTPKYASLYHRIISRYDHSTILELGTSLGINTLYLADHKSAKVTTFEGCNALADLAETTFEFAHAKNIRIVRGNIDTTLPAFLQSTRKFDFAFIDANHTHEATIRYFTSLLGRIHEKSMIIVDDIHYSPAMEKAWKEIKANKLVYGTIDLYRAGIVFFDPSLNKQNVILQF